MKTNVKKESVFSSEWKNLKSELASWRACKRALETNGEGFLLPVVQEYFANPQNEISFRKTLCAKRDARKSKKCSVYDGYLCVYKYAKTNRQNSEVCALFMREVKLAKTEGIVKVAKETKKA